MSLVRMRGLLAKLKLWECYVVWGGRKECSNLPPCPFFSPAYQVHICSAGTRR